MKNQVLAVLCLLFVCLSAQTKRSLSSSTPEWELIGDLSDKQTLNVLQRYHNASAILHFIELTHNITNSKNCIRQSLSSLNFSAKTSHYKKFWPQSETAVKTSNLLTNLFTANESLASPVTQPEFFESLTRANLQSDPLIFGSGIAFRDKALAEKSPASSEWNFAPFAFRNGSIVCIDLSKEWSGVAHAYSMQHFRPDNCSLSGDWFWAFAIADYRNKVNQWHKNSSNNFLITSDLGVWTTPYFDCGVTNKWLITYLVPFFGWATATSTATNTNTNTHPSVKRELK